MEIRFPIYPVYYLIRFVINSLSELIFCNAVWEETQSRRRFMKISTSRSEFEGHVYTKY